MIVRCLLEFLNELIYSASLIKPNKVISNGNTLAERYKSSDSYLTSEWHARAVWYINHFCLTLLIKN